MLGFRQSLGYIQRNFPLNQLLEGYGVWKYPFQKKEDVCVNLYVVQIC